MKTHEASSVVIGKMLTGTKKKKEKETNTIEKKR